MFILLPLICGFLFLSKVRRFLKNKKGFKFEEKLYCLLKYGCPKLGFAGTVDTVELNNLFMQFSQYTVHVEYAYSYM